MVKLIDGIIQMQSVFIPLMGGKKALVTMSLNAPIVE
jgi:hypothetical protein